MASTGSFFLLFVAAARGAISWTAAADGIWSSSCDFVAKDLSSALVPGAQCSGKCKATAGCTHYAWTTYQGGTCWMKKAGAMKQDAVATSDPSMVCGILWAVNWQGDWANGCDFTGQDLTSRLTVNSQCGPVCLSTVGCTHFAWTAYNGGTCWMKQGTRTKADAKSTLDVSMVCGVVGSPPPPPPTSGRQISVTNKCPYTVWMAISTNNGRTPLPEGTKQINTMASYTYSVPSAGWAGRLWPKIQCNAAGTNCLFGDSSPPCPTGGCQPPADTKAEFYMPDLNAEAVSWYDISMVDGYSLPMKIVPRGVTSGSCVPTTCTPSLASCPTNENNALGDLRVIRNGQTVACLSPCKRWNYPAPYGLGRNENIAPGINMCCPWPAISVEQCRTGPVAGTQFVNLIHQQCPSAYSYAFDDLAGLHNCPVTTSFDVTLCP